MRGDDQRPASEPRRLRRGRATAPNRDDEGLSEPALRALRVAATLAAVAADVRVRVGDGNRTAVEVCRPPEPRNDGCVVVPPCRFRTAVGQAHAQHAAGQPVEMVGLSGVTDPRVEIGLSPRDEALAGDVYRLGNGDQWTLLFPTTLRAEAAIAVCADLEGIVATSCAEAAPRADDPAVRIGFHHDETTKITLVHTSVGELEFARAEHHLAALHSVLARCAVEELETELSA